MGFAKSCYLVYGTSPYGLAAHLLAIFETAEGWRFVPSRHTQDGLGSAYGQDTGEIINHLAMRIFAPDIEIEIICRRVALGC